MMDMRAEDLIERLGLQPHPEGGWYRETWRAPSADGGRGAGTAIYYLLARGQRSHWHRVDASEIWLHHAGAALRLLTARDGVMRTRRLGTDWAAGELPQAVVAPGEWQAAEVDGDWVLVSCVVAPAFSFDGFEMAPPGWTPDGV
ncbi:cupin domain-containing protein [Neoasaia chiangmaiensis]|nr:cupin domain-containing protein [Neoasaia chiangmaiensis]